MSGGRIRIGLIGAGALGLVHAREVRTDPRAELVAVADVAEDARAEVAYEFGLGDGALFSEYGAMLDGVDLDAVVVATPHTLHYEQVVAALERDLHVLCEKPLVTDVGHAEDLVRRAAGSGSVLVPGYQRRFWTPYVWAREWWRDVGPTPTHVDAAISQAWAAANGDTWRSVPELSGGGILYDTGSHVLDYLLWMIGLVPERVNAEMTFADDDRRIDSAASLLVAFEGGLTAGVTVSGEVGDVYERVDVRGPNASVVVEGDGWYDRTAFTSRNGQRSELSTERERHPTTGGFLDIVHGGEEPAVTPYDAYLVTAVTEAAYAAARSDSAVDVDVEEREDLVR